MPAGGSCILLTERISWDEFPDYAEGVVARIGGRMLTRNDGGGERVWAFAWGGLEFWVTWDDMDPGVSIEPCGKEAAAALERLLELLRKSSG